MDAISVWVILGVGLLILEAVTVSFYSLFFGIGALATALLVYMDITPDTRSQLLVFGLASMASLLLFRKRLLILFNKTKHEYTEFEGEVVNVSATIPLEGEGKVFYRGADWIAYSSHDQKIDKNTKVKIVKVDGIKLKVEPV